MKKSIRRLLQNLRTDEGGTSTIEYALVAGLIIIGCISLIAVYGTKVLARWNTVNSAAI